ncbi:MAG: hypothetical protein M1827_005127 [Pycnora praestabilis]|nr:MAG: hypothetical protein M1827_005127 [Pycnora praestabilis]
MAGLLTALLILSPLLSTAHPTSLSLLNPRQVATTDPEEACQLDNGVWNPVFLSCASALGTTGPPTQSTNANPIINLLPLSNIQGVPAAGVNCYVPGYEASHNLAQADIQNILRYTYLQQSYTPYTPTGPGCTQNCDPFTVQTPPACDTKNMYSIPIDYAGFSLPAPLQSWFGDASKNNDPVTSDVVVFSVTGGTQQIRNYCAVLTNANAQKQYQQCNDIST